MRMLRDPSRKGLLIHWAEAEFVGVLLSDELALPAGWYGVLVVACECEDAWAEEEDISAVLTARVPLTAAHANLLVKGL
jgi:hypothetical protein